MVTALSQSVAWALEQLRNPAVLADAELTQAFRDYIARCESDEPEPRKQLAIRPDAIISPDRPPLKIPPRADRFDCSRFGTVCRHTLMVDGAGIATPLPCGECQPCREWRVFKIMVRYRHGIGEEQTLVRVAGFQNIDAARKWTSSQGKRCGSPRVALLRRTPSYLWESLIIYAEPLHERQRVSTARAMAKMGPLRGLTRVAVLPTDLQAWVPRDACVEGLEVNPDTGNPIRRRTCVFTGWPDYEEEPSDHLHNDGYTETGIMQTQREPTPLPGWAQMRAKLPLEERAALNAADWCNVDTLDDYIGPTALIADAQSFVRNETAWRECYRPVLRLLNAENKAPPAQCRGCLRELSLTPKGLCIRCALRSG